MFDNKKKLIAITIAGAFALPLVAQAQSSVTIYGKLYPQINHISVGAGSATGTGVSTLSVAATGAPSSSATQMEANNSKLGFRGTEDLGGNLKALFQLEMNVNVDDGTGGKTLFSRNTFVGMAGDFGTVKLGNIDTVYKQLGGMSFLGISSGNFVADSSIQSKQGFGTSSASSFHLRRNNSIIYESPNFGGVQALFDYSLGETSGSFSTGSVISTGLMYEKGPLYLAIAHEIHNDLFGGSKNMPSAPLRVTTGKDSRDTATRLTAQYRITKATRVGLDFARMELSESGGAAGHFENYRHNSYAASVQHRIGAVTLQASYAHAGAGSCSLVGGAVCSTAGLEGKQFNLGASYALSKRTQLFAIAAKLINGDSARYNNSSLPDDPAPGADITQVALGLSHSF